MNLRQIALKALEEAGMLFQEDDLVDAMDYGTSEGVRKSWLVRCRKLPKVKLRKAKFKVVSVNEAPFNNHADALEWGKENVCGVMKPTETGGKGVISISASSLREMLNQRQREKSASNDVHYAALTKLRDIITNGLIVESHPDYNKDANGVRSRAAGFNRGIRINVMYSAIRFKEHPYRVKATLKNYDQTKTGKAYAYSVDKIEVVPGTLGGKSKLTTNPSGTTSISGSILLNGVRDVNGAPVV